MGRHILMTSNSSWSKHFLLTQLALGFLLVGGCADLLGGIGAPPDDVGTGNGGAPGGGTVDERTGLSTTPACIEYCNDMDANCSLASGFPQYANRLTCISTCNTFPVGDANEPGAGNTLACRAPFAKQSKGDNAAEFCASAGPASEACGGKCEAWCGLYAAACGGAESTECVQACQVLDSKTGFNVRDNAVGNTVECRIYHATAALAGDAELHCTHAKFWPVDLCVDEADGGDINCRVYCQNALGACRGDFAVYDSEEECLATCAVFPLGEARKDGSAQDTSENTVACRTYHANAALGGAAMHCPHASPMGDGQCGPNEANDVRFGNCDSFCKLYAAGCSTRFQTEFGATGDPEINCRTACASVFADIGADTQKPAFQKYRYATSTATKEGNSLTCHTFFAVKALAELAKTDKDLAKVVALCGEVPTDVECGR